MVVGDFVSEQTGRRFTVGLAVLIVELGLDGLSAKLDRLAVETSAITTGIVESCQGVEVMGKQVAQGLVVTDVQAGDGHVRD